MSDEPRQLPRTLDEAVEYILERLDGESKATLLSIHDKREVGRFHFGWGTAIRNDLGLWGTNAELCGALGNGHPDDMSTALMQDAWLKLRRDSAVPGSVNEFRFKVEVPDTLAGGKSYLVLVEPGGEDFRLPAGAALEVVATSRRYVPWFQVYQGEAGAFLICEDADEYVIYLHGRRAAGSHDSGT
jgi:hypothetical protein